MDSPTEPDYVTEDKCESRHGWTKGRITLLTTIVLILLAVPCGATVIAWKASSKAANVETQTTFIRESLARIEARQLVQDEDIKMILRNGKGE